MREHLRASLSDGFVTRVDRRLGVETVVRRVAARAVDTVLYATVPGAMVLLTWGILWLTLVNSETKTPATREDMLLVVILVWLVWVWIMPPGLLAALHVYEVAFARRSGQTWAKRWLGICVVRSGESWPSVPCYGRLMLRWLILHVPTAVLLVAGWFEYPTRDRSLMLYGSGYLGSVALPALATRSRRGLHDLLAGTMVADARQLPAGHPARGSGPSERCDAIDDGGL